MRIVVAPSGPISEIEPMYALAGTLRDRGHSVLFCCPEYYRSRIMKLGYAIVSSGASFLDYLDADTNRSEELAAKLIEELPVQFVSFRDALREADLVIGSVLQLGAASVAQQRGLPYLGAVFTPSVLKRSEFPNIGVAKATGLVNKIRGRSSTKLWLRVLAVLNRERGFSHLPPVNDLYEYMLHSGQLMIAVDPMLAPVEQNEKQTATGFWFFDEPEAKLPPLVEQAKTVYIATLHSRPFEQAIATALKSAGFTPVIWCEEQVQDLPASAILTHADCLVHSGSVTLTASAVRFHVPQIVLPYFEDEFYWARRVQDLRLGSVVQERTVEAIVAALTAAVSDKNLRESAKALSQKLSLEGSNRAADLIERAARQ